MDPPDSEKDDEKGGVPLMLSVDDARGILCSQGLRGG